MHSLLSALALTFVPLFIVIDAFGNLPFVLALSEGMSRRQRRRLIDIALITAAAVGLAFLFFGQLILRAMGISVGSFAIAGGLILLALSIKYILTGRMVEAIKEEMTAVVRHTPPRRSGHNYNPAATLRTVSMVCGLDFFCVEPGYRLGGLPGGQPGYGLFGTGWRQSNFEYI
jgi:predicted tellurium resistance membrane protein TerC